MPFADLHPTAVRREAGSVPLAASAAAAAFAVDPAAATGALDPASAAVGGVQPKLGTILLLGGMTGLGAMSIDLYLPGLPAIGRDFAADAASVQRTMSAFLVGMAFGGLAYGPLSDRVGRRPALLAGIGLYLVATLGCALAPTIGWLVAGRFVQALGACAGPVIARAVVRDRYDHRDSARIFSFLVLVLGIAPLVAPSLGAWLVTFASWRAVFGVLAAVATIIAAAAFARLRESRSPTTAARAAGEGVTGTFVALFRQRRLVGYLMGGALNGAGLLTYVTAAPDLLITQFGFTPRGFGLAFTLMAAGVIGASQINRELLKRWSSDRILGVATLGGVAAGAGLLVAAVVGSPWPLLAMLFACLASYGFIAANTTAGALAVDPLRAGATSALIGTASFGVGAGAATLAGAFHDGTPRPMATVMALALAGAALAFHGLALPRRAARG